MKKMVCPSRLRAAFDWIESAGEWRQALIKPAVYAKAAAKNWLESGSGNNEITASDLRAVIEWYREHVPPKCVRCPSPAEHGKTRCTVHLAELAAQARERRDKRAELAARGQCPECGQAMPRPSSIPTSKGCP